MKSRYMPSCIQGLVALTLLVSAAQGDAADPTPVTIVIPQGIMGKGTQAFGVNPLVIPSGTTVTWMNSDTVAHEVHTATELFDSGILQPGQSYSYQFKTAGRYPYHCHIHGEQGESGTIEVQG